MTTLMEKDNAPPAVVRQSVLMRVSRTYVWGVSQTLKLLYAIMSECGDFSETCFLFEEAHLLY